MSISVQNKILVLGLGNPVLGDDGIGIRIVQDLRDHFTDSPSVDFEISSQAGLYLLDQFIGFDQVVIIDAIINDQRSLGEIRYLKPEPLQEIPRGASPHFIGLGSLIALGNYYRMSMPSHFSIVGIVIHEKHEIREGLSPELQVVYPKILQEVKNHINRVLKNQTVSLPV